MKINAVKICEWNKKFTNIVHYSDVIQRMLQTGEHIFMNEKKQRPSRKAKCKDLKRILQCVFSLYLKLIGFNKI